MTTPIEALRELLVQAEWAQEWDNACVNKELYAAIQNARAALAAQPAAEPAPLTMGESFIAHILAYWQENPDASTAQTLAKLNADFGAQPAAEPERVSDSDAAYWCAIRPRVIAALADAGLEIWSDKDRVWLHKAKP